MIRLIYCVVIKGSWSIGLIMLLFVSVVVGFFNIVDLIFVVFRYIYFEDINKILF